MQLFGISLNDIFHKTILRTFFIIKPEFPYKQGNAY